MEKLDLTTPNFTNENIAKLAELFPNCVTEKKNDKGDIVPAIDFDALRQEFSDTIVEGTQERYSLNWPGKREALVTANTPISKTLRPCRDESVDFDNTKNIFIEGDNLDALKLLQETYLGKVKMIYIDPPYNTGKDFIYNDNFTADKEEYDEASGQRDEEGGRLVANPDSNGRYHSDWLSMMYPRLKLARNMLREDGVIFISISDDEQASLKKMCDEVFGIDNFLGCACRVSKKANNQGDFWSPNFDYILSYSKNRQSCEVFFGGVNYDAYDQVETEGGRAGEKYQLVRLYMTSLDPMRGCVNQRYYIEAPDGALLIPPGNVFPEKNGDGEKIPPKTGEDKVWRWGKERYLLDKDRIVVKKVRSSNLVDAKGGSVKWNVFTKTFLNDVIKNSTAKPNSLIEDHINQKSSHELSKLEIPFSFAKPSSLIEFLCEISQVKSSDTVMDFFAGSASMGQAVMSLNSKKNMSIRYVLVQLPEDLNFDDKNQKSGYMFCEKYGFEKKITSIAKERIRRAGKQIREEISDKESIENLDIGFRVFKIDSSNMVDVTLSPDEAHPDMFEEQVGNIKKDRSSEDLLFQVLLDWGVDLSLPITREEIAGKEVFFVDGNALAACFDSDINEDFVKTLADKKPLRVVFRDDGFGKGKNADAVKINVEQIFKLKSPTTDIKVI